MSAYIMRGPLTGGPKNPYGYTIPRENVAPARRRGFPDCGTRSIAARPRCPGAILQSPVRFRIVLGFGSFSEYGQIVKKSLRATCKNLA